MWNLNEGNMLRKKDKKIKGSCFNVKNVLYPFGKDMGTKDMIKLAKKQLSVNKKIGIRDEIMSKDLDNPKLARQYLNVSGSIVKKC